MSHVGQPGIAAGDLPWPRRPAPLTHPKRKGLLNPAERLYCFLKQAQSIQNLNRDTVTMPACVTVARALVEPWVTAPHPDAPTCRVRT